MKLVGLALIAFLAYLAYDIWFGRNGVVQFEQTAAALRQALEQSEQVARGNEAIRDEISDLRQGNLSIEDQARSDLGMIKQNETFYRVIDPGERKDRSGGD